MRDPTLDDVRSIAVHYGFNMSDEDLAGHQGWLTALLAGFTAVGRASRQPARSEVSGSQEPSP